ncbi:O-antigen ligase family protein [Belliella marina]|uniref:O-antigen ligase family protein n=1 Tax=Belliella marina TaxID=1644146 RepID=A0ABW4VLD2_9BACT
MRSQHYPVSKLSESYYIFLVIMFTGAFFPLLTRGTDGSDGESGVIYLLVFMMIYMIYMLYFDLNEFLGAFLQNKLLFALITYVTVSFLWSELAEVSLKRSIMFCLSSLIGISIGYRMNVLSILKISQIALLIITLSSMAIIFLMGDLGKMDETQNMGMHMGAWKGVFIHKNKFGKVMSMQILVNGFLYMVYHKKRYLIPILLSFVCIYNSDSTSALLIALLNLLFLTVCRFSLRKENIILFVMLSILAVVFTVFFLDIEAFFGLFGKESDLTGRVPLWIVLLDFFEKKPWLGYGFESFWMNEEILHIVWTQMSWENIYQAHNGFIDVLIGTGIIGFLLLTILLFYTFFSGISLVKKQLDYTYLWSIAFLFFFLTYNLIESTSIKHNDIFWLFFVVTIALHNRVNKSNKSK